MCLADKDLEPVNSFKQMLPFCLSDPVFFFFFSFFPLLSFINAINESIYDYPRDIN